MSMIKIIQLAVLVFLVKSFNCQESEGLSYEKPALLKPEAEISPIDMLSKAEAYYYAAKKFLNQVKKQLDLSKELKMMGPADSKLLKTFEEVCGSSENKLSKCALKMFMNGDELGIFQTPDWIVTAILFYKYLLDAAHSFALCMQYYSQTYNREFFREMIDRCEETANYFLDIASFMSKKIICKMEYNYEDMPMNEFAELFPMTEPDYKDKTIHAIKSLYEYKKYIDSLMLDESISCFIPDEEQRMTCILDDMNFLNRSIKPRLEFLEIYLDTISCRSVLSQKPSMLRNNRIFVLKIHKIIWENLFFIVKRREHNPQNDYDQAIDLLFSIERYKMMATQRLNGKEVKIPRVSDAVSYIAVWGNGSSKPDFVWTRPRVNNEILQKFTRSTPDK